MKKTEKQHNAPPMPAHRLNATQSIAKHYHAIGIPMTGLKEPSRVTMVKAEKKALRVGFAFEHDKPAGSRQEAKRRTEEALAQHRAENGVQAHPAKKYAAPRKSSLLDLLRAKLPKAHSAERIDFARRMYAARVEARKANQPTLLSDMRGSVSSSDPRPKGMERCELYFPQRGAVPVGY